MLQEWKRKGKKFRHVEKDGEETTELSVKIRAAKFRDLPMSLRILIVNLSLFLILCAVFFMAGAYLYAPQAAGRNYVEACLAGDWNSAYDVCQFPDSTFLSRKNYVNAMTWKAKQDGTDGQETPEIKSFFMRRKQNLETGENRIYTVRYTLKGVSDSQEETLEIAAGDTVKWNFKEWYVVPKDSYVTDVEITVPADASFYLDGVQVGKKYLKETADNVSIYKIPYLFLGGHTIEENIEGVAMLCAAGVDFIELNISCPNVKQGGLAFGIRAADAGEVVSAVRKVCTVPLIVKLSPQAESIPEMCKAVEAAGADAISLCNTFQACAIDLEKRRPVFNNTFAGLSGPAVRPIALRMVWQAVGAVSIPVVGLGGILTGKDALEFIMAGAAAVQVGTANFLDPKACTRITNEIGQWMDAHGVKTLDEIRGCAR